VDGHRHDAVARKYRRDCAAGTAGVGNGDHPGNEIGAHVEYLDAGNRTPGNEEINPDGGVLLADRKWRFVHYDAAPY
jgi:uncharacterized cupin superfamily protein